MKFIHRLISLYFTTICIVANAQSEYTIRGKVSDEKGQAVAYANIALRDVTDSSLIGGTITDEKGSFNFRHKVQGRYLLTASFIGYETSDTTLHPVAGEVMDVGNIILRKEQTLLDEVVIRKNRQRAKQQVDQTTYYVNRNMRSASQTGVDLISQVPGVEVNLTNTVSLNGSTQIIILVNGAERDQEYLNQLDASRIDRIEIRSSGGLQYSARVSGVINIILKEEDHKGINGHIYANVPTQTDEVFSYPSASLNYSRKNTTWYTSYNGGFSNFRIEENNHKILNPENQSLEIIRTDSLRQENWSHKLHFGMDRFSNDRNQLSLYGFVSGFSNEQDGRFVIEEHSEVSGTESYHVEKDDLDKNCSDYGSVYFRHQFIPSAVLTTEGSYYLLRSQTGLVLTNPESGFRQVSESEPALNKTDLRAHFRSKISERVSVETGIQQQLHFMQDKLYSSFNYNKRVYAGYLQGAFNGDRFQLNGGLRAEHSSVIYSDVLDKKRFFLLPQLDLKYNLNSKNSLKISYGKRVSRPQIHQLNPNLFTYDRFTLQQGNPELVPEFTRKFSAMNSISFRENFLSYGIFYQQEKEVIEDLTMLRDSGSFRIEKQNLGELHYTGVEAKGSMNLHDKFSINTNIKCYHVQTRVSALAYNQGISGQSGLEIRGKMYAIWALKKDLSLSASVRFQSSAIGIQHQYREGVLYFISLKKDFFDRLKLEITSAIPFMRSFTYKGYDISAEDFTVSSEANIKMSMVPVWLKLKYSFASGSKVRHLERDNVFEEKRIKKGF